MYQSTVMCETSQQKDLKQTEYPKSTSYAEDFPVKMLAQQVKELVSLIAQGTLPAPVFGESMPGLFANLSQDGSWQKTCAGYSQSLLPGFGGEASELFCETWPKWGIVLDGHAMELPMLERHINESECSLWPTASVCGNYNRKGASATSGNGLATAVKNWPTPTVADTFTGNLKSTQQKPGSMHSVNLSQAVNCPTPTQRDWRGGCSANVRKDGRKRNSLDFVVYEKQQGQLNADWVELLMGLPIGWTDINVAKEDIESWQGWPAAINVEQYAYEPPRVIVGQKNRAKRLKTLGNGCVPQQVYLVFTAIVEVISP